MQTLDYPITGACLAVLAVIGLARRCPLIRAVQKLGTGAKLT